MYILRYILELFYKKFEVIVKKTDSIESTKSVYVTPYSHWFTVKKDYQYERTYTYDPLTFDPIPIPKYNYVNGGYSDYNLYENVPTFHGLINARDYIVNLYQDSHKDAREFMSKNFPEDSTIIIHRVFFFINFIICGWRPYLIIEKRNTKLGISILLGFSLLMVFLGRKK